MIEDYDGHQWFMVKEPLNGVEIACFRNHPQAREYVRWHAAGLALNEAAYQIVMVQITADEIG